MIGGAALRRMAFLLFPMSFIALSEMVGIAMILPIIGVLLPGAGQDSISAFFLDLLPDMAREEKVIWVLSAFVIFFILKNFLYISLVYIINLVTLKSTARFIHEMFVHYLSFPLSFHLNRNNSEILRDLVNGSSHSFEVFRQVLLITLDILIMLSAAILLLFVSPKLTLAVAAVLIVLAAFFYLVSGPIYHQWGERIRDTEGHLIKWITQSFTNIRDAKIMSAHDYLGRQVYRHALERASALIPSETAIHIPRQVFEIIIVVCFLVVILFLTRQGLSTGDIIGTISLFGMAALRLLPSITRILTNAASIRRRIAYIDGLYKDMIEGQATAIPAQHGLEKTALPFTNKIQLDQVSYAYESGGRTVVDSIQLEVRKGESIGIVGPSGAGKTTLIDIILGLLEPSDGRLMVDGQSAFENLDGWQKHLGYVPQTIFLLDDTLRRNIAFGIEDREIDENRVLQVIQLAGLDTVLADLPQGLNTSIGEFGTRLSGGQRQRVAIARALYRNPDVLVFDEATSALDSETEREITQAIDGFAGHKTILVIAHRLSTVRNCDKIVFMKQGRVEAIGSFDELYSKNTEFRKFAKVGDLVESDNGDIQ